MNYLSMLHLFEASWHTYELCLEKTHHLVRYEYFRFHEESVSDIKFTLHFSWYDTASLRHTKFCGKYPRKLIKIPIINIFWYNLGFNEIFCWLLKLSLCFWSYYRLWVWNINWITDINEVQLNKQSHIKLNLFTHHVTVVTGFPW